MPDATGYDVVDSNAKALLMKFVRTVIRTVSAMFFFAFFLLVTLALLYQQEILRNITYFEMLVGVFVNLWACISLEMRIDDWLAQK